MYFLFQYGQYVVFCECMIRSLWCFARCGPIAFAFFMFFAYNLLLRIPMFVLLFCILPVRFFPISFDYVVFVHVLLVLRLFLLVPYILRCR